MADYKLQTLVDKISPMVYFTTQSDQLLGPSHKRMKAYITISMILGLLTNSAQVGRFF